LPHHSLTSIGYTIPRTITTSPGSRAVNLRTWSQRYWASFTFVGLAVATLFFAASVTPSLLPRHYLTQGLLSGFALAVGYGVGVFAVWLWHYLEIPDFSAGTQTVSQRLTTAVVAVVAAAFLWWDAVWQNSIRTLMEMPPVETGYPLRVAAIALVTAIVLVALGRGVGRCFGFVNGYVNRVVPRRIANVVSAIIVVALVVMLANDVIARALLTFADGVFLRLDQATDDGIAQPTADLVTGSPKSFIPWGDIGRQGKNFIARGPTRDQISELLGREAKQPIRVYVGLDIDNDQGDDGVEDGVDGPTHRAQRALEELKRVGGFERSILIVAVPTGTGWLDPGGVDSVEYLHAGDTAIVATQYSYLPSWMTILVDPQRSINEGHALFDAVYAHWRTLPKDDRPRLYLFGLSLGALGSSASADLFTVFDDPIQGGVWSGPPFPSIPWQRAVAARDPGTPMWLPRFRDGSMIRFTGRENAIDQAGQRWGSMRFVYIQHPSDPMVFFSPNLAWHPPAWLNGQRGPDVSPYLRWFPLVTFLQIGFDLPMATTVPFGYGHNYDAGSYIDAWIAVTDPPEWTAALTAKLKKRLAMNNARP
jgi:uncharacterized membrane protein